MIKNKRKLFSISSLSSKVKTSWSSCPSLVKMGRKAITSAITARPILSPSLKTMSKSPNSSISDRKSFLPKARVPGPAALGVKDLVA